MSKYEVNPFTNKEVMAKIKVFDNLTFKVKVTEESRSHDYNSMKRSCPKEYCPNV